MDAHSPTTTPLSLDDVRTDTPDGAATNTEARARPLLKNPWFLVTLGLAVAVVGLVIALVIVASRPLGPEFPPSVLAGPTSAPSPTSMIEVDPDTGIPYTWTLLETPPRDVTSLLAVSLQEGEYVVGTDISPGRYTVTAPALADWAMGIDLSRETADHSDHSDPDRFFSFSRERVGGEYGTSSFTLDLAEGERLTIGYDYDTAGLLFRPTVTALSMTVTTGYWVVGLDIPAGLYRVTMLPDHGDYVGAPFEILHAIHEDSVANTIVSLYDEPGYRESGVLLKEGEVIWLSGPNGIVFD